MKFPVIKKMLNEKKVIRSGRIKNSLVYTTKFLIFSRKVSFSKNPDDPMSISNVDFTRQRRFFFFLNGKFSNYY